MKGLNIGSTIQPYAGKLSKGKVLPDIPREIKGWLSWGTLLFDLSWFKGGFKPSRRRVGLAWKAVANEDTLVLRGIDFQQRLLNISSHVSQETVILPR